MNTPSPLRRFQKNLNSGLIALVVLAILDRSPQDLYGLEIAALIEDCTPALIAAQDEFAPLLAGRARVTGALAVLLDAHARHGGG